MKLPSIFGLFCTKGGPPSGGAALRGIVRESRKVGVDKGGVGLFDVSCTSLSHLETTYYCRSSTPPLFVSGGGRGMATHAPSTIPLRLEE